MDRRRFLLLAAAAPLALSSSAEAALKAPTRVPPPQVRPLGTWKILDSRPVVEAGSVTSVQLTFRPDIDVAEPYINVWPRQYPIAPLPPPAPPLPDQPRIATPIPVGSPHRPAEEEFGQELVSGVVVSVTVEIPVAPGTCSTTFRVTVQLSDGPTAVTGPVATRRRSTFSFMVRVVGVECYTRRVADPELPGIGRVVAARPTSRPRPTIPPLIDRNAPVYLTRLAQFRTPTPP